MDPPPDYTPPTLNDIYFQAEPLSDTRSEPPPYDFVVPPAPIPPIPRRDPVHSRLTYNHDTNECSSYYTCRTDCGCVAVGSAILFAFFLSSWPFFLAMTVQEYSVGTLVLCLTTIIVDMICFIIHLMSIYLQCPNNCCSRNCIWCYF